jgi:hypothetical protein
MHSWPRAIVTLVVAFTTIYTPVRAATAPPPSPAAALVCAPPKLVHVVVANVTPGIDPTSFNAQPRVFYRIGSDRLRMEEAVDAVNGIHELIVVSEPNVWMANLYDGKGKHIVDPGPTFLAKAPVFGIEGLSAKFMSLEFGCEADFIAKYAPTPVRSEQVGNERYDVYRVDDGSDAVEILERPGSGIPALARYYQHGNLVVVLRYLLYETGLPNEPELFTPPPNVQYTEAG